MAALDPQPNSPLTFSHFSAVNRRRSESPDGFGHSLGDWSLSDWFTATMGELGEAANVCKKLNRIRDGIGGNSETEAVLRAKLASELADTFIYLDLLCQAAGLDLGAAVAGTFDAKSDAVGCDIKIGSAARATNTITPDQIRTVLGDPPTLDAEDYVLLTCSANADPDEGAEWLPYYKVACGLLIQAFGMAEAAAVLANDRGQRIMALARGRVVLSQRAAGIGPQEPTPELLAKVDAINQTLFG